MKEHFDKGKKAEVILLNEGDLVLALLPLPKHPLCSQYCGIFRVLKCTSEVNHVIETLERLKKKRHAHINLFKKYHFPDDGGYSGNSKAAALALPKTCKEENIDSVVEPHLPNSIIINDPS